MPDFLAADFPAPNLPAPNLPAPNLPAPKSLMVDAPALRAVIGHVATVADEVTGPYANQLTEMSDSIASALANSAISAIGTSPRLAGELHRLGAALRDWLHSANRSIAIVAAADEASTHRFG